jgi:glycerol-3-phosphate dehydrogenase
MKTQHVDIVILGGGIAGLWTLNRLLKLGFNAILLETNALGGGQTIQSQGIIHGGIKYALQGLLTRSANEISDMPKIWAQCLGGTGEIDLRQVNILSNYHYLWSTGTLTSQIGGFLANKVLHSHSEMLPVEQYPVIFQNLNSMGASIK